MPEYDTIVRERQKAVRREIDRRHIAIKAIQYDAGWKEPSTVLSYFPADGEKQPAVMSLAALFRFIETKAIPLELLSMLLPEGYLVIQAPEGVDHDEASRAMVDYLATKEAAHHPASEAGREIGPGENTALNAKLAVVKAA